MLNSLIECGYFQSLKQKTKCKTSDNELIFWLDTIVRAWKSGDFCMPVELARIGGTRGKGLPSTSLRTDSQLRVASVHVQGHISEGVR